MAAGARLRGGSGVVGEGGRSHLVLSLCCPLLLCLFSLLPGSTTGDVLGRGLMGVVAFLDGE